MGVGLGIGVLMVHAVNGNPPRGCILEAADAKHSKRVLEPFGEFQSLVGQQPVIDQIDAQCPKDEIANENADHARPTKEPRKERQQCQQMHRNKSA